LTPAFYRLWQTFRSGQPEFVKRIGRVIISAWTVHQHSPSIDAALLADCIVVPDRNHLIARLPRHGVIGEVGVETASFSQKILKVAEPAALHLFDIDFRKADKAVLSDARSHQHQGLSAELLAQQPDDLFDWLYIDGDHRYAGVKADCLAACSKVKPGGFMVFNDFLMIDTRLGRYGVHRAVSEFIVEHRWPVRYFALAANGHYDIAIQRPGH
jgi:Methyltransferase domain